MIVKRLRVIFLALLLLSGAWLLSRVADRQPEGVARQAALGMLAPAGFDRDTTDGATLADQEAVLPVVVNLRDIPAGVYDPDNQLDRWRRGEIDLDERESIVGAARLAELREAAMRLPASDRINLADGPARNAPTAGVGFDSLDYTECCGGGGNVPPDPELAAGPNHLIAVVNVAFEIYDTNGNSLAGPTTFASFMAADPNCTGVFDPNVLYDESADRFMLAIDADGTHYCVAVSQSGDPTGSWNLYSFPTASGRDFFDYPHAGVGNDAIYMGANIFRCGGGPFGQCSFKEGRVWAFDKAAMYAGAAAASVTISLGNQPDTPQPLNLHGWNQGTWPASGPHYFFSNATFNGANYNIYSWSDPFGANNFSLVGGVDLVAATGVSAGMPVDTPQSGGSPIQANDFRPQDFEYRNGYGWSVQTIACNPGGGTVNCIRWAQIDPATATVVDAGVYASNGQYRIFGDLAVNACDDMAVGYTRSSSGTFPGVWVNGRQSTDPPGTLQSETLLKAGEVTYTAFDSVPRRWGDYTEMTIAPDGVTFWYLGEYSKNTGISDGRWGTYIGSFSYACTPDDPPPTPTPGPTPTAEPPTPTPPPGVVVHVGDLDGSAVDNGNRWNATVTVLVHDAAENPVANATVNGSWSDGAKGGGNCTTNGSGVCTITKNNIKDNSASATFTVTSVSTGSSTYDAGANHDPDGDSNGTVIVVSQP